MISKYLALAPPYGLRPNFQCTVRVSRGCPTFGQVSVVRSGVDGEQDMIAELVESLRGMYPRVDGESLSELVHGQWATYDGARIRDYIPVLVTHSVRDMLSQSTGPYSSS